MLSIYVDDIKAAGPEEAVNAMWAQLAKLIDIEAPTKLERYLGCEHSVTRETIDPVKVPWADLPGLRNEGTAENVLPPKEVNVINYDMCSYVDQCLESYEELAGDDFRPYKSVPTLRCEGRRLA